MTYALQIINTIVANQVIFLRFLVAEKPKKIYTKSSLQGSGAPRQCMHINLTVSKSVRIRRPIVFNLSIMEGVGREVIADLVKSGLSYRAISKRLRELYPHITRGLCWNRIRKYCIANGLRTARPRETIT